MPAYNPEPRAPSPRSSEAPSGRKIVFLDFSGTISVGSRPAGQDFDYACVARVDDLCRRTGAVVVVISDWVKHDPERAFPDIKERLSAHGLTAEVVGHTPQAEQDGMAERPYEIERWLLANPDVVDFVILDDMPLLGSKRPSHWGILPADLDGRLGSRFLQTEWTVGVTDDLVEKAVQILGALG